MRSGALRFLARNLFLAVAAGLPPIAIAGDLPWLGSLALTSDYVHRGLTESSGQPAIQAGATARLPEGIYAALWGSTFDTRRRAPDFADGNGYEADVVVGWTRALGADWNWQVNGGYYSYLDNHSKMDYDHAEYAVSAGFRDRLRAAAFWSPHVVDHGRDNKPLAGSRTAYELAGEWPLTVGLTLSGGAGYCDLRRVSEVAYFYWSSGVNLRWDRYVLGLNAFGTDGDARERFTDGRADTRIVATLAAAFGDP